MITMSFFRKSTRLRMSETPSSVLADILESWMSDSGTRDLRQLLHLAEQSCTWKTAPHEELLSTYAGLARLVAGAAPNLVVSHTRLMCALKACHESRPCVFTALPLERQCASFSASIRCVLAKYRELKQYDNKWRIIVARAAHVDYVVA